MQGCGNRSALAKTLRQSESTAGKMLETMP
jgi:hypothetical protein